MSTVVLAVAGGHKTQSIVDACQSDESKKVLVVGYTISSQEELARRIHQGRVRTHAEVTGWFSFLMQHLIRPYLPLLYPGTHLTGLNFDGDPGRYATGLARFMDHDGRAYKLHIAKLAYEVMKASQGAAMDRLGRIYEEIFIDEVQDLGGWDLEIIEALLTSPIQVTMVGDLRQALLDTEARDPKNSGFRGEKLINWFLAMENKNLLKIEHRPTTYRCNQAIAKFSDTIFEPTLGYQATQSASSESHSHSGIFTVSEELAAQYQATFDALCLRHSVSSGRALQLPFLNFGVAKGKTAPHVLIYPTQTIRTFLATRTPLDGRAACGLYIAVTRAQHSVAFVTNQPVQGLTDWHDDVRE